jgi:hypothetical protein
MALNATLVAMAARGWSVQRCESAWGRSYIDHVRALAREVEASEPFDDDQARRCRELLAIDVMQPTGLVELGRGRHEAASRALELAREIVRACAAVIGS